MPIDRNAEPTFFATPADLRAWFELHHDNETELWVGFHKVGSGIPSVTWPQSVDQALCFGWIDGVLQSLGAQSYKRRFTPRTATSRWSNVNIKRVAELSELGLMMPAGIAAFEARGEDNASHNSYEQEGPLALPPAFEQRLRDNAAAWAWFVKSAPSYQKASIWWVISAKQDATRERRLAQLIAESEQKRTVKPLTPPKAK